MSFLLGSPLYPLVQTPFSELGLLGGLFKPLAVNRVRDLFRLRRRSTRIGSSLCRRCANEAFQRFSGMNNRPDEPVADGWEFVGRDLPASYRLHSQNDWPRPTAGTRRRLQPISKRLTLARLYQFQAMDVFILAAA